MSRETGYYWVKPKSTLSTSGTGTPNTWSIQFYMKGNENIPGHWIGVFGNKGDECMEEINETRITAPDEVKDLITYYEPPKGTEPLRLGRIMGESVLEVRYTGEKNI